MSKNCISCAAELDHCHGTLIEHHDGALSCTDSGCADGDPMRHELTATCESLARGCDCHAGVELAAVA
ncbi:MAG: hypothetical protein GEU86_20585 [Actinophytocola sp.]|nr:hypothetical protein [Actinophytocola sp.]